ncbi:SpaA isopeptide-forming pilin-related protein [Enterococcus faecalis]
MYKRNMKFLFMSVILCLNSIMNLIIPISAYAEANPTHNVKVDVAEGILVTPISGGESISGFCIDNLKVLSPLDGILKYEELEVDNPNVFYQLIQGKANRLPYNSPEDIFRYIKSVYYYGITENYSRDQIQDAIWEFTDGFYSFSEAFYDKKHSAEGKILYEKAVAQPLNDKQLSQVHIRIFKYISGRAIPGQNVIHIDIDTPEVPKEKEVQVSKVNLGGEEIAGANIEIKQGTQVVANWVSEVGKTHELRLLPGDYVFHEVAAPKGYVAVTDITFTVNTDGTVTVKEAQGNTVTGVDNKLTVTDQAEYVSPTGTLRTTVKANNVVGKTTEAAKVTADQVKNGVNVVDTITYSGLVPGKVYDVTGELYEVKDGQVVGAVKATKTAEYTVDRMGEGDWSLDFGKVTGLEAGKTYVVYETATSKDNLVDKNKDNTPEEKHVVEHKDPNDKAQTVVVTPEVPKEKEVQVSKELLPKTGEKNNSILIVIGVLILLGLLLLYKKKRQKF